MTITGEDRAILRALAQEKRDLAHQCAKQENEKLWRALNDLKMIKPAIYINEVPWHEMDVEGELTLRTQDPVLQAIEQNLRREIYSYKHFPGNMVITDTYECPIVYYNSEFGISEDVDITRTSDESEIYSRHFHIQIAGPDDIEKIQQPVVTLDQEQTEKNMTLLQELFGDILTIQKVGVKGWWFTPWDNLIRWTGVQEALMDLILEPEYIDKLVSHFVDRSVSMLEQFTKLGLWASNNDNTRVGSGGYGYVSGLDAPEKHPYDAPANQLWGCGNAQIFSDVSEQMHWDFSIKHEMRWLSHFGMNYYGCCEPLHGKLNILQKIPNLRKISTSPWAKIEEMAPIVKGKYVLSCKPNPAIFATDHFDEDEAKRQILDIFEKADGCSIELIMKDISTVHGVPQRLWRWAQLAQQTIDEFYGF